MSHQPQHWPVTHPVSGVRRGNIGGTCPVSDLDSSIQSQYPANKHWFWSELKYRALIDGEDLSFIITVNWLELVCLLIKFGCMHQLTAVVIYWMITVAWTNVETVRQVKQWLAGALCQVWVYPNTGNWFLLSGLIIKCEWCQANWRWGSPPPQLPHLLTPKWFLEERFQVPCINNKSLSGQGRVATCLDEAHDEFQFSQKISILQSVENFGLRIFSFLWLKTHLEWNSMELH